jgi:isopenicillin N synthase-like dioxygenase
MNEQA